MKLAFDSKKYFDIQRKEILNRITSFGDKLYLEFGGKLFDDYHASRVLPGFEPDSKLKMLIGIQDRIEIIIVVNSDHIISNKARFDIGISYQDEVKRLIDAFKSFNFYVSGVVFSFYKKNAIIDHFVSFLEQKGISVYKHYQINGYPNDVETVCSDIGFGKNDYIKTSRPLVVVTAPGPGSGKMAICLSQLYQDSKNGIKSGYAKFETFPVWNLPVKHPINLAYEAATIDLNDVNVIDPYHLEAYKESATNYNRDVASFPLLQALFTKIYGKSPYKSPTNMGVNMIGFSIKDMDVAIKASNEEIIRRYYESLKNNFLGVYSDDTLEKAKLLLTEAGLTTLDRKCVKICLDKAKEENCPVMSIQIDNDTIVTGKRSELLGAPAALILNTLKTFAGIRDDVFVLSPKVIEPIRFMKINILKNHNTTIHLEEVLLSLAIQADTNPLAKMCIDQIHKLKGLQAHSSVILPAVDLKTFKRLGINVTEEPASYAGHIYTK